MKGFGIYVENKLLTPKDFKSMGVSVWLYLWLLDKMTSVSESGIGLVLGGKPVTFEMVQESLGMSRATYKRHISMLRQGGYIKTTQAPYGIIFRVIDTKKIFKKRSITNEPSETDSSQMSHLASDESDLSQQSDSSNVSHGEVTNEPSPSKCEPSNIRQDSMTRQKTKQKGVAKATGKKKPSKTKKEEKPIKPQKPCKPPGVNTINQFWKLVYKITGNPPNPMENLGAAEWLYKNKGEKESLEAIAFAKQALEDHISGKFKDLYPPTIYNLMDLKDNYDKLRAYYGRKHNKKPVIG